MNIILGIVVGVGVFALLELILFIQYCYRVLPLILKQQQTSSGAVGQESGRKGMFEQYGAITPPGVSSDPRARTQQEPRQKSNRTAKRETPEQTENPGSSIQRQETVDTPADDPVKNWRYASITLYLGRSSGGENQKQDIGQIEGAWVDQGQFRTERLTIDGILPRAVVLEIGTRLNLSRDIASELSQWNTDTLFLKLSCDFSTDPQITRTMGSETRQEFNPQLIPQLNIPLPQRSIKTEEKGGRLYLRIEASSASKRSLV